jgi:hypothetical protein
MSSLRLAIGTILRSDDNVGSAVTQATLLRIGQWARARGVDLDFIPCMGAGKDLARAEVLAAFHHRSKAEHLLWIDNGNGIPGSWETAWMYLDAMMALREPCVWGPYLVRGGVAPAFACGFVDQEDPRRHLKTEEVTIEGETVSVRLLKLAGCGFGWTRMRRDVVDVVFDAYQDCAFVSNRLDGGLGELECVDVFSSLVRRRLNDTERGDRPLRLEPEDDSFWHRIRERNLDLWPHAMVDMPIAHGRSIQSFAAYLEKEPPVDARGRLVDARGRSLAR